MTDGPRPVTVEDLIILNRRAVLIGGGKSGVRDRERLAYAVDRPYLSLFGRELYPTHYDKAAALVEIIVWSQAFVDVNKRTGQRAGAALLRVLSERRLYTTVEEGVRVCLAVERKDMDTTEWAAWLYRRSALDNPARPS